MPQKYDLNSMSDPDSSPRSPAKAFPGKTRHLMPRTRSACGRRRIRGHQIRVETTYRITVDGAPVTGHVTVGNDGQVHYHAIPNQQFESAVDMVKRVIDLTPPDSWADTGEGHSHGDQHHH
jgi:hypothetical protein